ncbi:uncharacterized protein LOC107648623 [Arachis ipaensis]|uniref:uncharacterized protein LOC107648623 n=1 Tax=Arachis ipaensis TaxID=130454 RepID=UPI0007AF2142|nr:uncharacterized protein LOC107648623 [Arachis ipaensis]XP_025628073.1 uncharacterized protein LOC112721221 [Arachis hypogaea]
MEEDDSFPSSDGEAFEDKSYNEEEQNIGGKYSTKKESQRPEINIEKVNGIFNIIINEARLKNLRHTWCDTLRVKLLGRKISLPVLSRRLEVMWEKQGSIEVIDIGNDYFIVRFYSQKDLDFALTGGPWRIFYHYLAISFWKPNFNPMEAIIDHIAAWVRLPRLAIEYYEEEMLNKIGNILGRNLKVDSNTADKCRGKFARLCVELDLTESLVSQYSINRVRYIVEYEEIYNICFSCGMVGHEKSNCPKIIAQSKVQQGEDIGEKGGDENGGAQQKTKGQQENDSNEIFIKDKGKKVIEEEKMDTDHG